MTTDSLYLWNAPEGSENKGIETVRNDRLDEILSKPLTGDDIALKVMMAQSAGENPNLSIDEFKLYDEWHKKQTVKWWELASGGVGTFFGDIGSGLASLTPFGTDKQGNERTMGSAALNATFRLGPTATEALGRGTRDLVGLYQEASKNQNSPLYNLFNPAGDVYSRFVDFNKLAEWRAASQRIMEGKENVVMPNTSGMIGRDVTRLSPEELFKVNNDLAQAGSYFLDPPALITLGQSTFLKAGAKTALSGVMDGLAKDALKEGISGTASAFKNTAAHLDKGKIFGAGLTEKLGKSFRVAGEAVDKPINSVINWIKTQADELLDTNLHTTPNANLRITGPTKGQAGFGGSLMAGLGIGAIGLPYAASIVPIWAVANAGIIGGKFLETLGKEMANGAGVLGRMGLEQTSTGKLARMFSKWGPMGGYVVDMTKAVAKSGAYGAAIGYLASGEEGAAQGLGVGSAIGTTHYHFGVAHNVIKGRSREKMVAGLINNINELRSNGFTHKADTVLKYLSEIQAQHGDDGFFRNLGVYLAAEADSQVAVSFWDKQDFLRLKDDPTVPASVRDAINDVIKEGGDSWNGMFMGRNGKSVPYFIHKDGQSGKTHIIINTWAKDITGKTQATGLKGEFYHTLADAYKEAATKPRFIEEIFEGVARTLNGNTTPEGRAKLAQMFRNAADNLSFFGRDAKGQKGMPKRVANHLKFTNEQAPKGWEVVHIVGNERTGIDGFERPRYRWIARDEKGGYAGYDIYENANGTYQLNKDGKPVSRDLPSLSMAMKQYRELSFKPSYEPTQQGEAPPNVSGQRERIVPEPEQPKTVDPESVPPTNAQRTNSVYEAIDLFEKTGKIDGDRFHVLLEELGESIFDAHEAEMPFDYIFLGGDLGFARNLIEEVKHRFARIVDRNGRQAGFVPDFEKPFVDWFKDIDGKAIVDPYMRKLFKQFLRVHRERSMNLDGYTVDLSKMSPAMLKQFVEDNGIEHEYDVDDTTGNYVRKPDEQINAEMHKRYQTASYELLAAEKNGIATGFFYYASEADAPSQGSMDTQNEGGILKQEGWKQYRTTQEDILKAQRKGTLPTKEEIEAMVKRTGVWGNRNRPRTGDIDNLIATAKKGSIIFTGIPTAEAFKILQKHLPKKQMEAIAKIAPLIMDGGTTMNNVTRIKYAGFTHVDDSGTKLKRPKNEWNAVEKNMVFYGMELRATLRNPKSGKFDYKTPHAAFLLRGVDIDVLQRRIQWMWKNEKETRKRWANLVDFEKDVYRLVENYSAKTAMGGSRFFGGGDEGKAKKRLACAAIGAFPTRKMVEGLDADDVEFDLPEIDWHHYQLSSYGKGKNGRDIPWTNIRADAIKHVMGTDDKMRIPYAERAYYRAQELYQQNKKTGVREGEDVPVNVRTISLDVSTNPHRQKSFAGDQPDISYRRSTKPMSFSPSDILKEMRSGSVKMGARSAENLKRFVKDSIGHDSATDSVLVYWHGYVNGKSFDEVNMGQFGLHIGTLQAAMSRNYTVGFSRGIPNDVSYNSVMPLAINVKKPLKLADRGLWTPQNIAESILASLSPDQRNDSHPNIFESAPLRTSIRQQIGDFKQSDIDFLVRFIERQRQLRAKNPNAYQEAQIGLLSSDTLTPAFIKHSKESYAESKILHDWLRTKGIDAISYYNRSEGSALSYIIFDGKNAKNIAENVGEFSPDNISMLRQQASRYGAKSAEQAKSLESNYEAAVKEGDIFESIAIKNNFLGDMPPNTRIVRQTAEEAGVQGVSLDQYNGQFATGTPFVLPMLHATKSKGVAKGDYNTNFGVVGKNDMSHFNSVWWGSHMDVAKYFRDFHAANSGKNKAYISRALIKSKNPLVVDAKGEYWNSKKLNINKWLNKGASEGHDSVMFLNIYDDVEQPNNRPNLLLHNQIVLFPESANDNVAVIDTDMNRHPVPRGLGLVNEVPVELPFRQEAANSGKSNEEAKRTFYSAVEKFVEEKVTDKTSLQEIMGLLDPTRGTGIVKSELEFLDIAGWVEEQKKLNPSTKAKVDKAALLEYIRTHKFELQEDKTNKAWYTLQGMDPNNPQVQSQVEGGYESYTPAKKGYDVLHPTTNYRVLLLRAPRGVDYSGGEGGHFPDHENLMAFARVGDIYLDRETEIPSPLPPPPRFEERFFPKGYKEKTTTGQRGDISSFEYTLKDVITSRLGLSPNVFETITSDLIAGIMENKSRERYRDGTVKFLEDDLSQLGFIFDYLSGAYPEAAIKIASEFQSIIKNNFEMSGVFAYSANRRINNLTKIIDRLKAPDFDVNKWNATTNDANFFALLRGLYENPVDNNNNSGFYQPDAAKRKQALIEVFDLLKSLMQPLDLEIMNDMKSRKKMLMVFELQSDTAQKMQGRNDSKTDGIRTAQEIARLDVVLKRIEEVKTSMQDNANKITENMMNDNLIASELPTDKRRELISKDVISRTWELQPELHKELEDLSDERATIARKREKTVITDRDLKKSPEYAKAKTEVDRQFDQYEDLKNFFENYRTVLDKPLSDYASGTINEIIRKSPDANNFIEELKMTYRSVGNEIAHHMREAIYKDGKFTDFRITEDGMLKLYEEAVAKFMADIPEPPKKDNPDQRPWAEVFETVFSDKNPARQEEMRDWVFDRLNYRMKSQYGANLDFRYLTRDKAVDEYFKSGLTSLSDVVVTEYMPFLRTEDFSKLMFKKLLKEMVDGDYEGIILIPPELPQILTGGDSKYYYGTILPKVINGYTKKFNGKLRQNKSIANAKTDPLFDIIGHYLKEEARDPNYGDQKRAYDALIQAAKTWISAGDDPNLQQQIRDRITTNKMKYGLTKEQAEQVFDYFVQVVSGMRPDSQKTWGMEQGKWTGDGDIERQASRKGLILDRTPQMDAIKEGQPMWQAAARRKKKGTAAQPETVGDLQGKTPAQEEPIVPIDVTGRNISDISQVVGLKANKDRELLDIEKAVLKDGAGTYRGYKIVFDKANGGYKIFNPAGKAVGVPVAYIDRVTGEKVIKTEKHVIFIEEGVDLIDSVLGGMPKTEEQKAIPEAAKPAKVNTPAKQQVVAPEQRAIPVQDQNADKNAVEAQVKAGKMADYYGMFKIGFDPKMGKYFAVDNGGQQVSMLVPSQFQSGPRTLTGQYHPDLASVLQQLDKKFDKTKYANKAPSALATPMQAPVVQPQAAPQPQTKPTPAPRRVEASSVPPAVANATPAPKPKPTAQPAPKPKASIPSKPTPAANEPEVVLPKPQPVAPPAKPVAPVAQTVDPTAPAVVTPDIEDLKSRAKSLGKGFIEMLRDKELKQYIIDSLNMDDDLTLVGTTEDASTADGRFSVTKKGRKLEIVQNNYTSPITGIVYDKRPIAYVNTIEQAQLLIRRIELERSMAIRAKNMSPENGLAILAQQNPAYVEIAREKAIKDNALIQMLLSMRDQNIIPIYIDPETLQPLLVMMPSEPAISMVTRPKKSVQIAGLLPESGTAGDPMPLALIDKAITFDMFEDAEIRGLDYNTKNVATRFRNALGYEILKFKGKFRLFNPMKAAISVRDDEEAVINDIIADIHRNGLQK